MKKRGSRRFLTLRTLVLSVTGLMSLTVVALCLNTIWSALQTHRMASQLRGVMTVATLFLKASDALDAERAETILALRSASPADTETIAKIRRHRSDAETWFKKGLAALTAAGLRESQEQQLARIDELQPKVQSYRAKIDAALGKAAADRDPELREAWMSEFRSLVTRTQQLRTRLEQTITHLDGTVTLLMSLEQVAWTGSEYYTREWFVMDRPVAAGEPFTPDELMQAAAIRGRLDQITSQLRNIGTGDQVPDTVVKAIQRFEKDVLNSFNKLRTEILAASANKTAYPVTADDLANRMVKVSDELVAVSQILQKATEARSDEMSRGAVTTLVQSIFGLVLAVLVTMIGFWIAESRVSRPLNAITAAMGRIAKGEDEIEVPFVTRGDEVGDMARALQVFKGKTTEARRLSAERAEARRAKQARDATRDSLARAFEANAESLARALAQAASGMETTALSLSRPSSRRHPMRPSPSPPPPSRPRSTSRPWRPRPRNCPRRSSRPAAK